MARRRDDSVYVTAAGLGAIAGMRSIAAPALLTHELAEEDSPPNNLIERVLSSDGTARLLAAFAGAEMLADKTSFIPDRTSTLPLLGRAMMGSLTAAAWAARRRHPVLFPAALGAASAVASTFAAFHVRRIAAERFNVPDRLLGMIEDGLVLAITTRMAEDMVYEGEPYGSGD